MRSADAVIVGIPHDVRLHRVKHFWWTVPLLSIATHTVDLNQLRVIGTSAQPGSDALDVGAETVCRELVRNRRCRTGQFADKNVSRKLIALAQVPAQNQFAIALYPDEAIRIPDHFNLLFAVQLVALFLLHESPNFIHLHIKHADVLELLIHEPLTALAGQNKQPQDRIAVNAGNALCRADAHTFQKQLQDSDNTVLGQPRFVLRPRVLFGVGFVALLAAEAL